MHVRVCVSLLDACASAAQLEGTGVGAATAYANYLGQTVHKRAGTDAGEFLAEILRLGGGCAQLGIKSARRYVTGDSSRKKSPVISRDRGFIISFSDNLRGSHQ